MVGVGSGCSYPHQASCNDPYPFRHTIRLSGGKFLGNALVWFPEWYSFNQLSFRSYCDFGWTGCYQIIVIAIKDWLLIFTLPLSGVQIFVFNDNFWVSFPLTSYDWYIRNGFTGCELAQPHSMKHLRLIAANFGYQIIVARQHIFKI